MAAIEIASLGPCAPRSAAQELVDWITGDRAWTARAECSGRLPLFFGPRAERPQARRRREHEAKALCDRCPVLEQCRQAARTAHEYGYWGGESEDERHRAGFTVAAPIGVRSRLSGTR